MPETSTQLQQILIKFGGKFDDRLVKECFSVGVQKHFFTLFALHVFYELFSLYFAADLHRDADKTLLL